LWAIATRKYIAKIWGFVYSPYLTQAYWLISFTGLAGFRRLLFRKSRRQDSGYCDSFDEHNNSDNGSIQDFIIINCNKQCHPSTPISPSTPQMTLDSWTAVQRTQKPSVGEKRALPALPPGSLPSSQEGPNVPPVPPPRPQKREDERPTVPPRSLPPPLQQDNPEKEKPVSSEGCAVCSPPKSGAVAVIAVNGDENCPPMPPPRPPHTLRR
jgi:hypothetical protein